MSISRSASESSAPSRGCRTSQTSTPVNRPKLGSPRSSQTNVSASSRSSRSMSSNEGRSAPSKTGLKGTPKSYVVRVRHGRPRGGSDGVGDDPRAPAADPLIAQHNGSAQAQVDKFGKLHPALYDTLSGGLGRSRSKASNDRRSSLEAKDLQDLQDLWPKPDRTTRSSNGERPTIPSGTADKSTTRKRASKIRQSVLAQQKRSMEIRSHPDKLKPVLAAHGVKDGQMEATSKDLVSENDIFDLDFMSCVC